MAIEFARVRYVTRSDGGNACRSAAYNARSDVSCARTGERFFFAHREPPIYSEILLPEGAAAPFADPETLWNAAQAAERRKDSQEAREVLLALPSDPALGPDDWRELAVAFAREHFVGHGLGVQIDIHAPHDGEVNVHAHLLVTTRRIEGDRFSAKKARDLDPEVRTLAGGRQAVTEGERWGVLWRDAQNLYFERHGLDLRVDEIGLVPQRHEGPVRLRAAPEAASLRLAEDRAANRAAARDPEHLLEALTRNRATFTKLDIERYLRKHLESPAERASVTAALLARPDVIALHDRETGSLAGRYTTAAVRDEERAVIEAADRIKRSRRAVEEDAAREVASACMLDPEQAQALRTATGTEGLVLIEGLAGAGKSRSLTAIREAHERSGWRVIGLAPTNVVAEDLRNAGFRHGSTAHLELFRQETGRTDRAPAWDQRTLVMVDEAAMMDTRITARLLRHAADSGAKVILAGDDRQLASVARGGMFTALKERHGSVAITKIRRQTTEWQCDASVAFAAGKIAEGLRAYAEHGHVHWSSDLTESRTRLVSDWDQASRERPEVNRFVYASTNAQVETLNTELRDIRLRRGEVKNELEVETTRGKLTIGVGDRIQFYGNDRKQGIYNGSLATVSEIAGGVVRAETDSGRTVQFDTAAFQQFGLGYAGTVYRGQGKTKTEVFALYDNAFAWSARTAYVALTRHQSSVELYVSTDLARDETRLARQMERRTSDEASLAWATPAEVIHIQGAVKVGAEERSEAMRTPEERRKRAEEKPLPEIAADDPERAQKLVGAEEDRRREIEGATIEDRREALGIAFERQEEARLARLDQEARAASEVEQRLLSEAALRRNAEPPPDREPAAEHDPPSETYPPLWTQSTVVGLPTPSQLRYTEALAQNYDARDPYGSLARTSLAEAAAWQRERFELDQRIAAETHPERREALVLRRDIEHADRMADAHDRISGLARAMGGEAHDLQAVEHRGRAEAFREQAVAARQLWEERGIDHPALYPALTREMEERRIETRAARAAEGREMERDETKCCETERGETIARGRNPERGEALSLAPEVPALTPEAETRAMRALDLPGFAESQHGYEIEWRDVAQTRAILRKNDEELRAAKSPDGAWSYENRHNPADRGDILDFTAQRGAKTRAAAREALRPERARQELETPEHTPQTQARQVEPPGPGQNGPAQDGPGQDSPDAPQQGPIIRRGRTR